MTSIFIALFSMVLPAQATVDYSKLELQGASLEVEMDLDFLGGFSTGFLNTTGAVKLKRDAKGWSGRWGMKSVSTSWRQTISAVEERFGLHIFPGGTLSVTAEKSSSGINVRVVTSNGQRAWGSWDGKVLVTGSRGVEMRLEASDHPNWLGYTLFDNPFRRSEPTKLVAEGRLTPTQLVQDPVLFVLLYVLPFSSLK